MWTAISVFAFGFLRKQGRANRRLAEELCVAFFFFLSSRGADARLHILHLMRAAQPCLSAAELLTNTLFQSERNGDAAFVPHLGLRGRIWFLKEGIYAYTHHVRLLRGEGLLVVCVHAFMLDTM